MKEVDAITKVYDYLLWLIPKLEKFPRSQKFLLADRMGNLGAERGLA
ncbi:MAG: four helix bundle protein [Proteobacteria bacterium]|nr:four helix bundle protein [Pseudomonadota bacterium]MBU4295820.1 four helix bundle protein [Pseudomonadota bacterium]MCG2747844.1 four helix bundle protein [Desulfobulbaceae bacterium]